MELHLEEALRYLGAGETADETLRQDMAAVANRLTTTIQPRWTYRVFSTEKREDGILLKEANILLSGKLAGTMLATCQQAALLVCTLGMGFETMLRAEQVRDMARAVMLNACGSAWVESGCDEAEQEIAARFPDLYLADRFSPGYGDLPLSLQPAICAALEAQKRLGVHVSSESYLMTPSKTVTAVIGLSHRPQMARIRGCDFCAMRENCNLRKGGTSCAF